MATHTLEDDNLKHAPRDANHVGMTEAQVIADLDIDQNLLRIGHEVIARQKEEQFGASWKNHWRAACWAMFLGTALWMEGYDGAVVCQYDLNSH
jgi:MFS transporter, SP family, general alpha glucoside:H+ symporter